MPDDLISIQEAAEILGIQTATTRNLVSQTHRLTGYLPPGRANGAHVSKAEVLEYKRSRQIPRRDFLGNPDDPRHGTANGYRNLHCRCDRCTAANSKTHREQVNQPRALPPGDPRHGTYTAQAYWKCKCALCRPSYHRPPPPAPKPPVPDTYVGITEAAKILGVTRTRLHQLIERGDIAAVSLYPAHRVPSKMLFCERSEVENYTYPEIKVNTRTPRTSKVRIPAVPPEYVSAFEAAKILHIGIVRFRNLPYLVSYPLPGRKNPYYLKAVVENYTLPPRPVYYIPRPRPRPRPGQPPMSLFQRSKMLTDSSKQM